MEPRLTRKSWYMTWVKCLTLNGLRPTRYWLIRSNVVRYGRFPVGLGVGLAPAGDAFVGIDSDEDEILCLARRRTRK